MPLGLARGGLMDKSGVMLSVCLMVYNHEKYVAECLEHILAQKVNFGMEILVGNDCSTDRSAQVIRDNFGDRVTLIDRKENVGLCKNLYDVLLRARGKYVYVFSGDDFIRDEQTFRKQVDFLESHPEYFSASGRNYHYNQATGVYTEGKNPWGDYTICDFLASGSIPCVYGTMRNVFGKDRENNGFLQDGARNNEEIKMWLYTMDQGKKYIFKDYMTVYRSVESAGASNYNSTHNATERFVDYYGDLKIAQKIYGKKYNLKPYRLNITNKYCVLASNDLKSFIAFLGKMNLWDRIGLLCYKVYLKFHHYQMPKRWKTESYLIR